MPLPQQPLPLIEGTVGVRALALPTAGALRRPLAAHLAAAAAACRVTARLAAAGRRHRRVAHEAHALHVQRLRRVAHRAARLRSAQPARLVVAPLALVDAPVRRLQGEGLGSAQAQGVRLGVRLGVRMKVRVAGQGQG